MKRKCKLIKKSKYIFLVILFLLTSCTGDNPQVPDEIEFYAEKYPQLTYLTENIGKANTDPNMIDISEDIEDQDFVKFLQWDLRWGLLPYNQSYMAIYGSAPTAMAMVLVNLDKNLSYSPYFVAKFFEENNWTVENVGTSWKALELGSNLLGLNYKVIDFAKDRIDSELKRDRILLASVQKGDFTKDAGLIVIYDLTEDGYRIADPMSKERSDKLWSYQDLIPQIIQIWSYYKN